MHWVHTLGTLGVLDIGRTTQEESCYTFESVISGGYRVSHCAPPAPSAILVQRGSPVSHHFAPARLSTVRRCFSKS